MTRVKTVLKEHWIEILLLSLAVLASGPVIPLAR